MVTCLAVECRRTGMPGWLRHYQGLRRTARKQRLKDAVAASTTWPCGAFASALPGSERQCISRHPASPQAGSGTSPLPTFTVAGMAARRWIAVRPLAVHVIHRSRPMRVRASGVRRRCLDCSFRAAAFACAVVANTSCSPSGWGFGPAKGTHQTVRDTVGVTGFGDRPVNAS